MPWQACVSSCLRAFAWLLSAYLVYVQSVPEASGAKAKVQAATATLQHASTAKQPPKGNSAVDATEAVASAVASVNHDKEVQVRTVTSPRPVSTCHSDGKSCASRVLASRVLERQLLLCQHITAALLLNIAGAAGDHRGHGYCSPQAHQKAGRHCS